MAAGQRLKEASIGLAEALDMAELRPRVDRGISTAPGAMMLFGTLQTRLLDEIDKKFGELASLLEIMRSAGNVEQANAVTELRSQEALPPIPSGMGSFQRELDKLQRRQADLSTQVLAAREMLRLAGITPE